MIGLNGPDVKPTLTGERPSMRRKRSGMLGNLPTDRRPHETGRRWKDRSGKAPETPGLTPGEPGKKLEKEIWIMSTIESKARELMELRRMREELDAEIEAAQDAIKAEMGDSESITAGAYKITWKPVESTRIDTRALKAAFPEIASHFTITSTVRRFCVN